MNPDALMIGTKVWLTRNAKPPARPLTWVWRFPADDHKPLRGNYPDSYTSTAPPPAQPPVSHFDWRAAAVGAAGMLGLILLLAAGRATARIARNRRRAIPFVVDVRDETPTTS